MIMVKCEVNIQLNSKNVLVIEIIYKNYVMLIFDLLYEIIFMKVYYDFLYEM